MTPRSAAGSSPGCAEASRSAWLPASRQVGDVGYSPWGWPGPRGAAAAFERSSIIFNTLLSYLLD